MRSSASSARLLRPQGTTSRWWLRTSEGRRSGSAGQLSGITGSFYLWGDVLTLDADAILKGARMMAADGAQMECWFPVTVYGSRWAEKWATLAPELFQERRAFAAENPEADPLNWWHAAEGLKRPWTNASLAGFNNWPKDETGAYVLPDGTKIGGDWFSDPNSTCRKHGSRSLARKAASAQIAKIPYPLALHIARTLKPLGVL